MANAEGNPGLPLGLGMHLANDGVAYANYNALTNNQKLAVIHYVRGGATGMDVERLIENAMEHLRNDTVSQLI